MNTNTLFQSVTDRHPLTEDAKMIHGTLDLMTSLIVGRLISERLIDYAGQPGEVIEHLSRIVASAVVDGLLTADMVEIVRLHNAHSTVKW